MKPNFAIIHCQPTLLNFLKENDMNWSYSDDKESDELDVVVDDIPYDIVDGTYQDPDEALCDHYGIDYNQVNMIEALY